MRSESGVTLVEVVVALAVIALAASLAMVSGAAIIRSGQASRATSRLLDHIAIARMSAVAQTAKWRIRFDVPPPGSTVVRGYTVESCAVSSCSGGSWVERARYVLQDQLGLAVPFSGSTPDHLMFNPDGFFPNPTTEISVCRIQVGAGGVETCQSGYDGGTIRIHGNTGVIEH